MLEAAAEALAGVVLAPPGSGRGNSGGLVKPGRLFLSVGMSFAGLVVLRRTCFEVDAASGGASTVGAYVIAGRFKFPNTLSKMYCVFDFAVGVLGGVLMSCVLAPRPTLPASVLGS